MQDRSGRGLSVAAASLLHSGAPASARKLCAVGCAMRRGRLCDRRRHTDVASAFYQAVEINSPRWSTGRAIALGQAMARSKGLVADTGLVLQPHRIDDIALVEGQKDFFSHFGYQFLPRKGGAGPGLC